MLSRSRGLDLIALSLGCSINRVDSSIPPKLVFCVTGFILTQFSVLINQMPVKKTGAIQELDGRYGGNGIQARSTADEDWWFLTVKEGGVLILWVLSSALSALRA